MHYARSWFILVCLVMISAVAVVAQEGSEIPQVTITITSSGFIVPSEMPEGAVMVTYENNTEAPVAPYITRLNEGVTADELRDAASQDNPFAALSLSSDLGGTAVMPGVPLQVTYAFVPGSYLISNLFGGDVYVPFTVTDGEGEGAAPPEADLNIGMVDFAFNVPLVLPAGSHTLHLDNRGAQFHMMLLFRLNNDLTVQQIHEMMMEETEELPEGVEEVASWFPMSEGEQAWIDLTLEPGTYLLFCPLPDVSGSGHSHHELGMRQFIIVTEAQ